MTETPFLSFVLPVRDDAPRLRRCLNSILADDYPDSRREIIVVDNGSGDGSEEVARRLGATVIQVCGVTVAELRNRGAAAARGDILAFIDADHQIDPGWSRAAAETLGRPRVAAAGDLYHAPEDGTWVQRVYDTFRPHGTGIREVAWLGSGNLAVRSSVFRELRGFDSSLVTCEDVDLCQRLRERGYAILADGRMHSIHYGDPATLRGLFLSELWRGRNNLHVSLRGPMTARDLPSIVIPFVDLCCLLTTPAGALVGGQRGLLVSAAAGGTIVGLATIRALRLLSNSRRRRIIDVAQAFVVALAYDLARALALVIRRGHHRRRREVR